MRITQGAFSFLPDLSDEQIEAQLRYALRNGWSIMVERTDDPHPRNALWEMCGQPHFDVREDEVAVVLDDVRAAREAYPRGYVTTVTTDRRGRAVAVESPPGNGQSGDEYRACVTTSYDERNNVLGARTAVARTAGATCAWGASGITWSKPISTSSGVLPEARPSRCATRNTCVSTASVGSPKAVLSTTLAVLRPTPGRASSASRWCGTSPPCSAMSACDSPITFFALLR